nr:DDE-type integrase/transposase/recombinase [Litoreibacter roseus]
MDRHGHLIDFRLAATRDGKAARAFMRKAIDKARLHRPVTICTDKAPTYRRVIREINHRYDPHFESITHIDKKWKNNRIESDHAALKRLLGYRQSFRSVSSAKATLCGIEAVRTIKNRHVYDMKPGIQGEIALVHEVFGLAA